MADLGRWLGDEYRIPVRDDQPLEETDDSDE
jgi:endogenous inhibitor of DNA gyrase (YacG/DUF329 family)